MSDPNAIDDNAEGTPSFGGDIVGPGSGGTPTDAGTSADEGLDPEAADDPDVKAMLENLRSDADGTDVRTGFDDAAEEVGTGTDR